MFVTVRAKVYTDATGVSTELPVLVTPAGVLEPLLDYCLYRSHDRSLKKQKADAEDASQPFTRLDAYRHAERVWESAMKRFIDLAEDLVACWRLIERCNGARSHAGRRYAVGGRRHRGRRAYRLRGNGVGIAPAQLATLWIAMKRKRQREVDSDCRASFPDLLDGAVSSAWQ
jgi:hypothetical protein